MSKLVHVQRTFGAPVPSCTTVRPGSTDRLADRLPLSHNSRCRSLTIRWSRRGGPRSYCGQSDALAAPQLSSGVIRTRRTDYDRRAQRADPLVG
jgi:hypothetical protein